MKSSLAKLNRKKAAGPDEIVIEMLAVFDDFGIDKIADKINGISSSVFIVVPKKSSANECKIHQAISLSEFWWIEHIEELDQK